MTDDNQRGDGNIIRAQNKMQPLNCSLLQSAAQSSATHLNKVIVFLAYYLKFPGSCFIFPPSESGDSPAVPSSIVSPQVFLPLHKHPVETHQQEAKHL